MIDISGRPLGLQARRFAVFAAILVACFAAPLWALLRFCWKSDFFSYIPLVPVISAYLIGIQKAKLPKNTAASWLGAALSAAGGLALLGLWFALSRAGAPIDRTLDFALMVAALLFLLLAGAFFFFGSRFLRSISFPVAFLAFCIPLPDFILDPTVSFFQYTSAWTAEGMIKLVGTPVTLDDLTLRLPNIYITIAPECSGIHSTMVLLMTAFLAGHMFLKSPYRRAALVLFVGPLAILRNGFRIFTISELCVHIGPQMIDSPIHHHGGPIFFALSLVPFFLLLVWLRKTETAQPPPPPDVLAIPNPL